MPPLFSEWARIQVPEVGSVVAALCLYIAAGFLVPAYILNRLRKREWTYAVILASAALATFGIYRYGLLSARESTELYEITILRLHKDAKEAEATTFLAAVAPGIDRIDLNPETPLLFRAHPFSFDPEIWYSSGGYGRDPPRLPRTTLEVDALGRLRLPPITLYPNGLRLFRCDYRRAMSDIMEARIEGGSDPGAVWLTYRGRGRPRVYFADRGGFFWLGWTVPNTEVRIWSEDMKYDLHDVSGRAGTSQPEDWRLIHDVFGAMTSAGDAQTSESPRPDMRCIVAVTESPAFPGGNRIPARKALTMFILPLED